VEEGGVLSGDKLLEEKQKMSSDGNKFDFKYNFNTENKIEGWD
jgi:hypothetical protein